MRSLTSNLALKLLSLFLAVLLWLAIAGEKTSERGFAVPVELINLPRSLELVSGGVNSVDVRLRAAPGIIGQLGAGNVSAQIDLSSASAGEHIVHVTPASIRVPFGVRVVKVQPSLLTLVLEETLLKDVPVRPRTIGAPAKGYEVSGVATEPATVRLAGPRSHVARVSTVFTEPVDVSDADSTRVFEHVSVGFDDPSLHVDGPSKVRVVAQIRERQEERVYEAVKIEVREGRATVSPASVRVVVVGPRAVVQGLASDAVRAYVNVARLKGTAPVSVAVELRPGSAGVSVASAEPATVSARRRP